MRAHDMSKYWRLVNVSGGRVAVDLAEHMIGSRVRADVLAQRGAVEAAILAAAEAVDWPEDA